MRKNQNIIATITDIGHDTAYKSVRAECSMRTLETAVEHNYEVIAVDAGSPYEFVTAMQRLGVHVVKQVLPGMGNAQRQALQTAQEICDDSSSVLWTESEKYPLIPLIDNALTRRRNEQLDLLMLRRKSLDSYPPEQAMSYRLIALAMQYLTDIESDFGWGPTIMSPRAIDYYTAYSSSYGDSWDAIHIPKLHIMYDQLPWAMADVDYIHPPEQTAAETGIPLFMKRIGQAEQLSRALISEAEKLGIRRGTLKEALRDE